MTLMAVVLAIADVSLSPSAQGSKTNVYLQRFMEHMQQRTIVRSLTTNDGTLVAMNDGSVVWKPIDGRPTRTSLDDLPTVLLALRGPMGPVDAAAVGTAAGRTRPHPPEVGCRREFTLQSGGVRAITLVQNGVFHFLVGTQHGAVWSLCDDRKERCEHIFSIDGPVSSSISKASSSMSAAVGFTTFGVGRVVPRRQKHGRSVPGSPPASIE